MDTTHYADAPFPPLSQNKKNLTEGHIVQANLNFPCQFALELQILF